MCFPNLHLLWRVAKHHEIKKPSPVGEGGRQRLTDEVLLRLDLTHWVNSYTISNTSSTASGPPSPTGEGFISTISLRFFILHTY